MKKEDNLSLDETTSYTAIQHIATSILVAKRMRFWWVLDPKGDSCVKLGSLGEIGLWTGKRTLNVNGQGSQGLGGESKGNFGILLPLTISE